MCKNGVGLLAFINPAARCQLESATQNVFQGLAVEEEEKNVPSAAQEAEEIKGNLSVCKILYLSISLPSKVEEGGVSPPPDQY